MTDMNNVKGKRGRKKDAEFVMPTDEKTLKAIENAAKESSNSLIRTDAEKDLRKEITKRMKEEIGIPAADFNGLVMIYHKQNLAEVEANNERKTELYRKVFGDNDE